MKITCENNNLILTEFNSFKISETLECGQCFRFEKLGEEYYSIIAFDKVLKIKGENNKITFFNTTQEDFNKIWIDYFDLNTDYEKIKLSLKEDKTLNDAISYAPGIRILNQDFFECLISFIISQNNRIPMIKKVIKNISEKYGTFICEENNEKYYSFPTPKQLINATEEELHLCKTGFRAKYIIGAVELIYNKKINFSLFKDMSTNDIRDLLMSIKGVGPKVADCVLLFSCKRKETFPTDVWIKRIMSYFYFDGKDTDIKTIHELANKKFGNYAGFAQQYLFHYARQFKIGK